MNRNKLKVFFIFLDFLDWITDVLYTLRHPLLSRLGLRKCKREKCNGRLKLRKADPAFDHWPFAMDHFECKKCNGCYSINEEWF